MGGLMRMRIGVGGPMEWRIGVGGPMEMEDRSEWTNGDDNGSPFLYILETSNPVAGTHTLMYP